MAALSIEEADTLVLRYAGLLDAQTMPLSAASGRVLRQEIIAERPQPPYDRVMMDGIALHSTSSFPLRGQGMQQAGRAPKSLPPGQSCFEVTTGAVLPDGADCVVPVEQLRREKAYFFLQDDAPPPRSGQFVHLRGSDAAKGQRLLTPGEVLNGPSLAVLAANGYGEVAVSRLARVMMVATGDELVDVGAPVEDWQIRRSNDYAVAGMFHQHGGAEPVARVVLPDDMVILRERLEALLAGQDMLILSGGVSMGVFDFVPKILAKLGVERVFHKVMQRPGGPLWFGIGPEGQRVFGLPGNPVSAMVCMARYVLPQLDASLGKKPRFRVLRLLQPLRRFETRTRFVPVRIEQDGGAMACPVPTSGDFMALSSCDGVAQLAPGPEEAPEGGIVPFYAW